LSQKREKITDLPDKWLDSFRKKPLWKRCHDRGILVVWSLREEEFFNQLNGHDFIRNHIIGEKFRC